MTDWTRDYFDRGYGQRWGLNAPSDRVREETRALFRLLGIAPDSRIVDIGCGHGRHGIVMTQHGARVIGVDGSSVLLDRARQLASECRADVRWIRADMRHLPFEPRCADAVMVIDAFGFFETDAEHDAVLTESSRVLKTGGRLALKVVNGERLLYGFRDFDREERDGAVITISRTLQLNPLRVTETIRVDGPRGAGGYERRQRLFRADDLRATLERAGFLVEGVFASPDGMPFDAGTSPSMWFVGQRSTKQ